MARGNNGTTTALRISASPEERKRLEVVARAAIAGQPAVSQPFKETIDRFVATTAPARDRLAREAPRSKPGGSAAARRSVWLTPLGYALQGLLLLSVLFAGAAVLPPIRASLSDDRTVAFIVSNWSAWVASVTAVLTCVLPTWGSRDVRRTLWQLPMVAAIWLALCIVYAVLTAQGDVEIIGRGTWTSWLGTVTVALALTLVALVVALRRRAAEACEREGRAASALYAEYFATTAEAKAAAVRAVDSVIVAHPQAAAAVADAWRTGIDRARHVGRVSQKASKSAHAMTALRWQLEMAAEPDHDTGSRTR